MKFGRYEVMEELGKGAMGVVYSAHDPQIDRIVALKALRSDYVDDDYFVQRFFKEAVAIGRLSHPNIVTVYDVGRDQGTIYIAMEYLMGQPLSAHVSEARLPVDRVLRIGIQMAEALDYAHGKGVVHRDIKPANVIVGADDRVKITDFGIAHIDDAGQTRQTQAGEILGTPVYMSPEQVLGETPDCRSDIYALGVILYELCAGRRPFQAASLPRLFRAITDETPPAPADLNPAISPGFSEILLRCLAKQPVDRFQTGRALAEALRACAADDGICALAIEAEAPPATPGPGAAPRRRRRFVAAGVMVALLLGGGVAYWRFPAPPAPAPAPEPARGEMALLSIQTAPPAATVFVDGDARGRTPLELSLPLGKHEVRVALAGHHDWEAQLDLIEAEPVPLRIRLQPTP
jgi:serine/threonine-protein kinase